MAQQLKWQLGTVVEVRQETPKAKSLILDLQDWTTHLAGQHVDVRLSAEDGYQAQRSYSIASPPEHKNVMITVERIEDGEVSPYLTDTVLVGDRIELRGPIGGYFVWDARDWRRDGPPLLLVAGGSGIAPLMSMIRHRFSADRTVPTTLLCSSRSYEEVVYREELDRLSAHDPTLRVIHTLTRRRPPKWMGYERRVDRAMLADVAWRPAERPLAFVCGSTAFVETVATHLEELGYDSERIKTERFGPTGE
jgi:ferredoxin-NADP reductase